MNGKRDRETDRQMWIAVSYTLMHDMSTNQREIQAESMMDVGS